MLSSVCFGVCFGVRTAGTDPKHRHDRRVPILGDPATPREGAAATSFDSPARVADATR